MCKLAFAAIRSPANPLLRLASLGDAHTGWRLVLTKALSLIQEIRPNDQLSSILTDCAAFVQKRALCIAVCCLSAPTSKSEEPLTKAQNRALDGPDRRCVQYAHLG